MLFAKEDERNPAPGEQVAASQPTKKRLFHIKSHVGYVLSPVKCVISSETVRIGQGLVNLSLGAMVRDTTKEENRKIEDGPKFKMLSSI